ncbi:Phage tail fiber protein [Neorhizobium galegae bv. officinalis]|nr:Phage tail fiber protein [Neorhizobium galegae bv. officinalis]
MGFLAPVFTVIGGFLGSGLGQMVVGLGLNLIVSKIEKDRAKKAQKAASGGGTQFDRDYGENVSRKVLCGLVGVAGHDCYVNTYGPANQSLEQVYVFSDFPCDGLSKIWAGGSLLSIALGGDGRYHVTAGDYAGRMFFKFYDGTQAAADAGMIAHSNPFGRWTANHVGAGMCWLKVELVYDQEKLSQFPDFFFELRGARLYDLRKDSSVGGSGDHRWGDYSTYEYNENPVVIDYNYRRGFSWNDDLFLGMDMPASDLPFDQYVTAANICDEIVGGERRYRCSIILDADLDHGDNIDALMTACGGIVIDSVEGSWPLIGTEQPIVATFTDDDLVAGEPVRFRRRRSMADLVNVVSGTYQEPANMWSPAGYDPQTDATTVATDRRTRDVPLNLGQVFSKRQANQLASIYFNENRYEATADVVLRPGFRSLKAGDWVFWNSANETRRRVYMVQSRSIRALDSDGPRNVALSLQERDGAIYEGVGVAPPPIPLPNNPPVYLNQLQDLAIIAVVATGADGRAYPAFRLSWSAIDDVTVTGIVFEWWIKTEPANKFTRQIDTKTTVLFLQEGIVNLTDYEFRHRLVADRSTNWVGPVTVTSQDGGNPDLEVGLGNLRDDVKAVFAELFSSMNSTQTLLARLQQNLQINGGVSQTLGRKLQQLGASFTEEIAIITSDIANVVEKTEELVAEFGENLANGMVSFRAVASPEGVSVRYAILLKATLEGEFKESGLFLDLYTEDGVLKSRIAAYADQFVIVNGDGEGQQPFVFEAGILKMALAHIVEIISGKISIGKTRIDTNGITVSS